jgi:hypothetical protein
MDKMVLTDKTARMVKMATFSELLQATMAKTMAIQTLLATMEALKATPLASNKPTFLATLLPMFLP